jgi:pimeloyl-ACP methyl ester carboxylesterase
LGTGRPGIVRDIPGPDLRPTRPQPERRPPGGDSIHDDVADLAALIETLGLAPAWIVGNSFGASISLRLALDRSDLLRGLLVHEPPLLSLLADDPEAAPMLEDVKAQVDAVLERIATGDHEAAAQQFIETVAIEPALGPRSRPRTGGP